MALRAAGYGAGGANSADATWSQAAAAASQHHHAPLSVGGGVAARGGGYHDRWLAMSQHQKVSSPTMPSLPSLVGAQSAAAEPVPSADEAQRRLAAHGSVAAAEARLRPASSGDYVPGCYNPGQ
jgi:hypothetical protein